MIDDLIEDLAYRAGVSTETALLAVGWIATVAINDPRVQQAFAANDKTRFCEAPAVGKAISDAALNIFTKERLI